MTCKKIISFVLVLLLVLGSLVTAGAYSHKFDTARYTYLTEQEMLCELALYETESRDSRYYRDYYLKRGDGYHIDYRQVIGVNIENPDFHPAEYGFTPTRTFFGVDATTVSYCDTKGKEKVSVLVDYGYNLKELSEKIGSVKTDGNIASYDEVVAKGRDFLICRYAEYTDCYFTEGLCLVWLRAYTDIDEDFLNSISVEYKDVYVPQKISDDADWFEKKMEEGFAVGDANKDGELNIRDATVVQKYCAKLVLSIDRMEADFNGDLKVDIKDATNMQKKLAGLEYLCRRDLYPLTYAYEKAVTSDETRIDTIMHFEGPTPVGDLSLIYQADYDIRRYDTVIESEEEFKAFFGAAKDEFDKEFFAKKSLVYLYRWYSSTSIEMYPANLYYCDGVLNIVYKYRSPDGFGSFNGEIANYNVFYEVDKAQIEGLKGIVVSEQREIY